MLLLLLINCVPSILKFILITYNIWQLQDHFNILYFDKIKLAPAPKTNESTSHLTRHAGMDMGENETSTAKKLLDINRGSYNNISVTKHKKINNKIHIWNSLKVKCHPRKL